MTATSDYLLADARAALRRRVSEDAQTELGKAFAAWLLHDGEAASEFVSLVREAATREGAQQDFQTVALMGFGADAGIVEASQIEVLKKGIRRQAGREVVIDELPAAFCSDAVGILGVVLGTKVAGDPELTDQVVKWISKFLKRSYEAERTDDWHRCLFAAADQQLGNPLKLSIPKTPASADVRMALQAKGTIASLGDSGDQDAHQILSLAMRELPDRLPCDRAAVRLAAVESIIRSAVPAIGSSNPSRSTKRGSSLSDRDQRVHDAIGRERFSTLANAEIMRDVSVKKVLNAESMEPGSDAAKRCLDRIRGAKGYPLSRQITEKRSSRN